MANIELVIKIPEGLKKDFESEQWTALSCMEMKDALMKGTPLPKGHGRLIDADKLEPDIEEYEEECIWYGSRQGYSTEQVYNAPTIIEADKGE